MEEQQFTSLAEIKMRAMNIIAFLDGFMPFRESLQPDLLDKLNDELEILGNELNKLGRSQDNEKNNHY